MKKPFVYSVLWNLFLVITGSIIYAIAVKSMAIPHQFVPGGVFGASALFYYATGISDPGTLYFLISIPLFIFGIWKISRRFILYSLLSMLVTSASYQFINFTLPIENQLYAALAYGTLNGVGGGIVLRSLGSTGGVDILSVYLLQKFNIAISSTSIVFNLFLYIFTAFFMSLDIVIVSMLTVVVTAYVMNKTLSLFNQRKMAYIISEHNDEISEKIMEKMHRGVTMLKGVGAYTGKERNVLMTVVDNIQLKKLEEIVFTTDEKSMFIVENTFSVLGTGFSRRKMY